MLFYNKHVLNGNKLCVKLVTLRDRRNSIVGIILISAVRYDVYERHLRNFENLI